MAKKPIIDPDPFELWGLGSVGIIKDIKGHLLPPTAMTDGRNVRFTHRGVERFLDYQSAFGDLAVAPSFVMFVNTPASKFWIYASEAKLYVYDGVSHTDITRQTDSADVDYTLPAGAGAQWGGTVLGSIPILNNGKDVPQYWTGLNVGSKMADLTAWPDTLTAKIIKAAGPYLVALNLVDDGAQLQKTIRWSSFADPGTVPASWDVTDPTVDAGELQLTDDKGGQILDGVLMGNQMTIYTDRSMYVLRETGGIDILTADLVLKEVGILTQHCACTFMKGSKQLVVTQDDIVIHQNTQDATSIIEDKDRISIFNEIDTANFANSFVFENAKNNEVWFCYPTSGNINPDTAAVWNYKDNTITFKDVRFNSADSGGAYSIAAATWADKTSAWDDTSDRWANEQQGLVVAVSKDDSLAYALDQIYDPDTICFFERTEFAFDGKGQDGQPKASTKTEKQLNRMWIKATGTAVLKVKVGTQELIDGDITWLDFQSFNCSTDKYLDWICTGKLLAYRIENNDGLPWTVEGIDLQINLLSQL